MAYLIEQAALLADARLAFDGVGDQHTNGYASYFFTRRALTLLEGWQPRLGYSPECVVSRIATVQANGES
jgi:hypothetical protein